MEKQKILVIDDEKSICQFLKVILEEAGFEVFTACSGEEGLVSIAQNEPALIILDMKMPKMSGIEFYAKLADRNQGIPKTPILILSGQGEMKPIFENLYVYGFITKPIVPSDFLEIVNRIFEPPVTAKM